MVALRGLEAHRAVNGRREAFVENADGRVLATYLNVQQQVGVLSMWQRGDCYNSRWQGWLLPQSIVSTPPDMSTTAVVHP